MDEKETLIRLEQELKNFNSNQERFISAQNEIFDRIDKLSKEVYFTKASTQTFNEIAVVKEKNLDNKFDGLEKLIKEVKKSLEEQIIESQDDIKQSNERISIFKDLLHNEEKNRSELDKKVESLKSGMEGSLGTIKILVTIIGVVLTVVNIAFSVYFNLRK